MPRYRTMYLNVQTVWRLMSNQHYRNIPCFFKFIGNIWPLSIITNFILYKNTRSYAIQLFHRIRYTTKHKICFKNLIFTAFSIYFLNVENNAHPTFGEKNV